MLLGVLNSERAIKVNIEIIRTFVRLRRILTSNAELARKLDDLEKKYDAQFKVVFGAIRSLMTPRSRRNGRSGSEGCKGKMNLTNWKPDPEIPLSVSPLPLR